MEISPQIRITEKSEVYKHSPSIHPEGGIKLEIKPDDNFLSNTKAVLSEIGSKVLKGDFDLAEVNLPPGMLSHFTRLELIAAEFPILSKYLAHAATVEDIIERFKSIVAGYVKLSL